MPITEAIDFSEPLVPILRSVFGVNPWAASAVLRQKCLADVGARTTIRLLKLTDSLAPEKAPKTPDEWAVAVSSAELFSDLPAGADSCRSWFREASRGWNEFNSRHFATGTAHIQQYGNALWNAASMAIGRRCADPPTETGLRRGLAEAMDAVKFSALAESASRWYTEWSMTVGSEKLSWEPIMKEPPYIWEGISIVPLVKDAELSAEGRAMKHCAASLATACYLGDSHIVSLNKGSEHLSTAELKIVANGHDRTLIVVQHKGHGNEPPPPVTTTALLNFIEAASAPEQLAWLLYVEESALKRRAKFNPKFADGANNIIYRHLPATFGTRESFENSIRHAIENEFVLWNDRYERLYHDHSEDESWEIFWQVQAEWEWTTRRAEVFLLGGCDGPAGY